MQKAKGNHHKMNKNQSDRYRIPRVVGEYDPAKRRDKGLPGRIGEAVVGAAGYLNRVMTGKAYAERIGMDTRKSTLEGSATGTSNDEGLMGDLGFPEKSTDNSGVSEGSTDTLNPNAGEVRTKRTSPEKHESAVNYDNAKYRLSEAIANSSESHPLKKLFGRKKRQEELNAATEELKKSELVYEAATDLEKARKRFSEASAAVESHFFKRKKRQEELNAATEELKKSELKYMRLKFADKIEAAKQDPEKQAELAAEMAQAVFASMQETSRTTTDEYDNMLDDRGKFKKAATKVGKWFNKGGRIAQWLKLGGTGLVGGFIVGSVATWPITTAVGLAAGVGVANLVKLGVLEEHRDKDILSEIPIERLGKLFKVDVKGMDVGDVIDYTVSGSIGELHNASVERQDDLRKRMCWAMGRFGAGFALGGLAGKFVGDWANSAHATGAESNTTTPSQSGSGEVPQSGGASSADNPAAKAIVNTFNPDTSNFNSYDYPWDWAAEKFGNANAMDQLHNLADKAMANGHTVEWLDGPGGTWLKVDGSSATARVLGVLSRYV